jgi:uncharacterized protein
MKFIVDSMLGRLARWLRLLGCDTLYYPSIEDRRLIRIASEEGRVLITRDTRLVRMRGLKHFLLLNENDPFEQLRKVITTFKLNPFEQSDELRKGGFQTRPYSRCSLCNTILEDVPSEQAKSHVPEYVYQTSDRFKKCPTCGKFYWKGTHPGKLRKKLMEIL